MAGYEDTRQKIISTLMGRPVGTEIQPENQQEYELNMLDYIRSLELIATSTLIGVAESNTTPVQPNSSRVCYIAGVAQNQTIVFENFINENGNPISVTTGDMEGVFVILMWNTQYWSVQTINTNIISQAEQAVFYYRYNIRKTYASIALMDADVANPIGTDGKYIKIGDIVTVVNSTTPSENGIYSYEGSENGWKYQSSFNFSISQFLGNDPNTSISQKTLTELLDILISALNVAIGNNSFYINSSGSQVNDPNYHSSDFFSVIPGFPVLFKGGCHPLVMALSFYDKDKIFLSGTNFETSIAQNLLKTTTVPTNAVFCKASYNINEVMSVVTTTSLSDVKKIAETTANSVQSFSANGLPGNDGVSIYRNIGSKAIWNTDNKYAVITLNDSVTVLSLIHVMIYSYEKNYISDLTLGIYEITVSGILKIISENNSTEHVESIKYIASTKQILLTFVDTNKHRVISVNEVISTNSYGNIKSIDINYYNVLPSGDWVTVNNLSKFNNIYSSISTIQNQITDLQSGTFSRLIDYWPQATIVGYINKSGVLSEIGDNNWRSTDYLGCLPGQKIKVRLYGHTSVNCISLYSSSKTYITGYKASTNNVLYENEITIPDGVTYFRISGGSDTWGSSTLPHYAERISEKNIWDVIDDLNLQIEDVKTGNFSRLIDYWPQATIVGYINKSGVLSEIGDNNWRSTDYLGCKSGSVLDLRLYGHTAVNNVSFYNGAFVFISGNGITTGSLFNQSVTIPDGAVYMRISGGSDVYGSTNLPHYAKIEETIDIFSEIEELNSKIGVQLNIPLLSPWAVYTVCNNTIVAAKGRNRNYSQAVYIDHFFNGLTSEKNIRVKDGVDKIVFNAPMVVTDSNETSPAVTYNGGVNVLEETKTFTLHGKDIVDTNLSIKHRSVLNSITASAHPKVLCIGDSITYAEQANIPDDNYTQNYAYHLICKELFMKDAIDNGNSGHDITFLGIYEKTKTFVYNGQTYNVKTHHEGIRGISISQHLNGQVSQFKDDSTGKWSLQAWLSKYRTLDDNGNRLTVGAGTGTLINSGNINSIDVCTPTHVIIMLGANGGGTLAQWQEMVGIIKTEFPNMIVGISIPDAAGTYFPSLHPNCNTLCTIWNDTGAQGSRHNQQYGLQSMLQSYWGDLAKESINEYILPFYYVAPTAESVALRSVHMPDSDINLMSENKYYDNYGWHASTHVNGIGQTNWGYALYSWIKYTIGKTI